MRHGNAELITNRAASSARCRAIIGVRNEGSFHADRSPQRGGRRSEARPAVTSHTARPGQVSATRPTAARRRHLSWLTPRRWSIAARSAFIAGAVVFIALAVAGAALTVALYQVLLKGV